MNELTINLTVNDHEPMYAQLYNYIKNDIKNGKLGYGSKLPSTRALSQYLDVSRSTTQMAYDQLLSEGYIESVPCKGYFVCQIDGLYNLESTIKEKLVFEKEDDKPEELPYNFSPRGIELDSFPYNAWRKINKNVLIDDNKELFNIGHPQGELQFRTTISQYLHQSRGVNCHPEQIIVGAGSEYLLMLLNQLLEKESAIAMENPTYKQAYNTFLSLDRAVIPVDMDKSGMNIEQLEASQASLAYVMPSHQYPLGIIMPIKRRTELLNWANKKENRYIIEDDYDSEFRYKGKPIPSLQSSDSKEKVIYLGTFSKSIAPAIRMSYMVLPLNLLEKYLNKCRFFSSTVSRIDQTVVNSFIQEGYYERHLNKMRALYKTRHDILLNECKAFEKHFTITGDNAGIHILLTAKFQITEEELITTAKSYGVKIYPLSNYYISTSKKIKTYPTIIIGYANIRNDHIIAGLQQLKKAWNKYLV